MDEEDVTEVGLCKCGCGARTSIVKWSNAGKGLVRGTPREFIRGHRIHTPARHGHARRGKMTSIYMVWYGMCQRCHYPGHRQFQTYGGRGITVIDEWRGHGGFERFLAHVGARPSATHSLDRLDSNGHYEPGNVRWATRAEQARNTSRNINVTIDGRTMCLKDWCAERGVPYGRTLHRLHNGADPATAMDPQRLPSGSRAHRARVA